MTQQQLSHRNRPIRSTLSQALARSTPRLAAMEPLESRQLMSGTPTPDGISFSAGNLYINPGSTDDVAVVSMVNGKIDVTLKRTTYLHVGTSTFPFTTIDPEKTFDPAFVNQIRFFGNDGNDSFTNNTAKPSLAIGGAGADTLVGGTAADTLIGGLGDDTLQGRAGDDSLTGGDGNDTYVFAGVSLGADTVTEAANLDEDTLDFSSFGVITRSLDHTTATAPEVASPAFVGPTAISTRAIGPINIGITTGVELDTRLSVAPIAKQAGRFLSLTASIGGISLDLRPITQQTVSANNLKLTLSSASGIEDVLGSPSADVIYGNTRTNHISGNGGNDRLYAGQGRAFLNGGAGNDTLVTIGGATNDSLAGGIGTDSFWADSTDSVTDASAAETAAHHVHKLSGFASNSVNGVAMGTPSIQRLGQFMPDPKPQTGDAVHYANFSGKPLFAPDGPSLNDIFQGGIGDCYFLASLSALAKSYPDAVTQMAVDLGDGTFAVNFHNEAGKDVYVRVDADLPVANGTTSLAYAGFGHGNSLWAPIIEKAWAFFRNNDGKYDSINGGNNPGIKLEKALNLTTNGFPNWPKDNATPGIFDTKEQFMQTLYTQVKSGKAMTIGGPVNWEKETVTGARRGQHVYMVYGVQLDAAGKPVTMVLRNPWGTTGPKNDGYLYIPAALAFGRSGGFGTLVPN